MTARWLRCALGAAVLAAVPGAAGATPPARQLAEQGPAAFAVGALFTLSAPFALAHGVATGGRVRLHACRLGAGLEMLVASAVLLPAGLLVASFRHQGLPTAWLDAVVASFQEDTCTRALGSLYP